MQYFGIIGNNSYIDSWDRGNRWNVTDISPLANFSNTTKKAIIYLYLNNLRITSLVPVEDFTNVRIISLHQDALKTFEGIQNMSNLQQIWAWNMYSDALGARPFGIDESATTSNAATDALSYIYKNNGINNTLNYLDIQSSSNVKWLTYLNGCTALRTLKLSGCSSIKDASALVEVIKNCSSYLLDSQFHSDIAAGAKTLDFSGQTMTVSKFESLLKNNTTIQNLRLSSFKLTTDSGTELTNSTTPTLDSELNSVLKTCTNLKVLWLNGITNLYTIEFVKTTPYLQALHLYNTNITTYSGDASKNGLELLNTYCSDLGFLALWSLNSTEDITLIQPALNKVSTKFYYSGQNLFVSDGWRSFGLLLGGQYELAKLSQCTNLTIYRATNASGGGLYSSAMIDMTNCHQLTSVRIDGSVCAGFKMPAEVETVYLNGPRWTNSNLEGATSIKTLYIVEQNIGTSSFNTLMNQLKDKKQLRYVEITMSICDISNFSLLKDSGLENIQLYPNSGYNTDYVTNLGGIPEISTLKTLRITGLGLNDLTGINKLTNLTTLTLYGNQIQNISPLENCQSLVSISISSNKINDIYVLRTLKNLSYLDIQSNALTDTSSHDGVGYDTLDIFYDLNYQQVGSLKNLYIAGNYIDDTEILIDLSWSGKNGF